MNNTFDFNRFSLLVKRQWVENKKLFLMEILILVGLEIVFYTLSSEFEKAQLGATIQFVVFFIGFFICGALFTNSIFKDFSDRNSTTGFLLTPASHLEKLMNGTLFSLIVFPIVFLTVFYILDNAFVSYLNYSHDLLIQKYPLKFKGWKENVPFFTQLLEKPDAFINQYFASWLVTQIFVIVGSITFNRWSLIKTGVFGLALLFAVGLISTYVFDFFIEDVETKAQASVQNIYSLISPTREFLRDITIMGFKYVLSPILLLIAYFKLKEKQV